MSQPARKRLIRPNVINDFDNPYVQVKCDPTEDELDLDALIYQSLTRFEFILGTLFRVQLISLDGTTILAYREYMVTQVREEVRVDQMNFSQTMTRTVFHRKADPISDWHVFDERAASFRKQRKKLGTPPAEVVKPVLVNDETDLDKLSPAKLQGKMKDLTGKGFAPGTSSDDMREGIREALKNKE